MRFNDKLLSFLSQGEPIMQGRLHYKKVGGNHAGFREKWFKLKFNILFYFNLSENGTVLDLKPAGAFILENCTASQEFMGETPFSFSLQFRDEKDRKHMFSGRTDETINQWITALNSAGYDKLRAQILQMRRKLDYLSGQKNESEDDVLNEMEDASDILPTKPSFRSYIEPQRAIPNNQISANSSFFEDNFMNCLEAIGQTHSEKSSTFTKSCNSGLTEPSISANVPLQWPHRQAPDPPKRPPRNVKATASSSNAQDNLIQF